MPPRREPRSPAENNFPDFGQFGEAIAAAIQSSLRPTPRNTLDIVSRLKINDFYGNKGPEKSEIWFDHVEKTFRVMHRQGNLSLERWVETATWFFRLGAESWWDLQKKSLSDADVAEWDVFKQLFKARFIPPEYMDSKKNEFIDLRQGDMSATEYHRRFTDLSRYCLETAANPREMLRLFKRGTCKKWRNIATAIPCATYQEFFEVLLRIEDSDNAPDDENEGVGRDVQRYNNRGRSSLGPIRAQNFKNSGNSSGSSSGGSNSGTPQRGGRSTGSSRFQNQGNSSSSGVQCCRRCNTRHYGECKRGSRGCFTCG
ncbi:uncharacterized protein [Malus domestica]|uniref:uncharacterized protein n=1 Tax=Malus domestica TaxID=3750 RepID=UPI003975FE18